MQALDGTSLVVQFYSSQNVMPKLQIVMFMPQYFYIHVYYPHFADFLVCSLFGRIQGCKFQMSK